MCIDSAPRIKKRKEDESKVRRRRLVADVLDYYCNHLVSYT